MKPFFLKPACKSSIWGGTKLKSKFGKDFPGEIISESWELSVHPAGLSLCDSGENIGNFFDMLPMAVVETDEENFRTTRANDAYRGFMQRCFDIADLTLPRRFDSLRGGLDAPFADALIRCREEGVRIFFDAHLPDGSTVHSLARHVAKNPVTGITAVAVAVLGISES